MDAVNLMGYGLPSIIEKKNHAEYISKALKNTFNARGALEASVSRRYRDCPLEKDTLAWQSGCYAFKHPVISSKSFSFSMWSHAAQWLSLLL